MRGRRTGGAPAPPPVHHPSGSIAASAEAFLTHLAARAYSPPSIEAHRWALKGFVEWAGSQELTTPASFTRARIEAFQLYLHQYRTPRGGKPLVTNTQLARLGCVRRFFAWLCRSGVIPANPAADLDLPRKQARQLPKAFSAKEIQALMAVPDPSDAFGLRDRAILELFYATGIRRTEMVNLDHGDYDPASLTLTIRKGKGGKSRMLPVGERAAAWLDRFLAESRPLFHHLPQETALFLSGYGCRITPAYLGNWIKGLMKSCGIDKPGSCHLLRHSCATDMHRGGADIRYVQEMLGHARMETTQIYTHVHIEALREIHARTHPHGRLDETHDMYGLISAIEAPEHDLPSPPAENPLQPEAMWVAAAPGPEVSAAQAGISNGSCPRPPDEEPPAGGSPCATPKPPSTGGPSSAKSPLDPHEPAQKSTEIQRFRPGVAYYGYRWLDPATGRWPSRDPIEESGGINLYGFIENDGVNRIDYLGLKEDRCCVSEVKITYGFFSGSRHFFTINAWYDKKGTEKTLSTGEKVCCDPKRCVPVQRVRGQVFVDGIDLSVTSDGHPLDSDEFTDDGYGPDDDLDKDNDEHFHVNDAPGVLFNPAFSTFRYWFEFEFFIKDVGGTIEYERDSNYRVWAVGNFGGDVSHGHSGFDN